MPDRRVLVSLEAPELPPVIREGVFTDFTSQQRVLRSAGVFAISVVIAALFIPIPIIHLLAIPMALGAGILVAVRQLAMVGRLAPMRMACPKCGALNRVGGGIGVRTLVPQTLTCDSCRRSLVMQIKTV